MCLSLELEADTIGRGRAADIAQHHLGPARSVEDDPRRRDEQIARRMDGSSRGVERGRGEQAKGLQKAKHGYDPHNRPGAGPTPSRWSRPVCADMVDI